MRLPLALLVLSACSSTAPSRYEQGAPVRPPPAPAARPGVGAPVMGQPGAFSAPLPRSPNSRPLPPSSEPGLWSADTPKASAADDGRPILYGIEMPTPAAADPAARFHAAMCARSLEQATQEAGKASLVEGLSRQQKACLALQLQDVCLLMVRGVLPRAQRAGLDAIVAMTRGAMERECIGVAYGKGAMKKAFDDIGTHWFVAVNSQPWWRIQ